MIKFQETGWPNSLLTLKFRFYNDNNNQLVPQEIIPIWNGTVQFNPSYNENRPPQVLTYQKMHKSRICCVYNWTWLG